MTQTLDHLETSNSVGEADTPLFSAKEVEDLQANLRRDAENLRLANIDPKRRAAIIRELTHGVQTLAVMDPESLSVVHTAAEVAADVASVTESEPEVVEIAHDLIENRFGKPTGDPTLDQINLESLAAYTMAIGTTDSHTPFTEALQQSELDVDDVAGRSYEEDVIQKTEVIKEIIDEQNELERAKAAAAAGRTNDLPTGAVMADELFEENIDTQPIDVNKLRQHASIKTFQRAIIDDENERIPTLREMQQIRGNHPRSIKRLIKHRAQQALDLIK